MPVAAAVLWPSRLSLSFAGRVLPSAIARKYLPICYVARWEPDTIADVPISHAQILLHHLHSPHFWPASPVLQTGSPGSLLHADCTDFGTHERG